MNAKTDRLIHSKAAGTGSLPSLTWTALTTLFVLVLGGLWAIYNFQSSVGVAAMDNNLVRTHTTTIIQTKLETMRERLLETVEEPLAAVALTADISKLRETIAGLKAYNKPELDHLQNRLSNDLDQLQRLIAVANRNPAQSNSALNNLSLKKLNRMLQANTHALTAANLHQRQPEQAVSAADQARWAVALPAFLMVGLILLAVRQWLARHRHTPIESDHQHLKHAIEGLPDGCIVLNQDREVTVHNSSVTKLMHTPRDTIDGVDAASLYSQICLDSTQSRDDLSNWLDNLHPDSTSSLEVVDHRNRHLLIRERPTGLGDITATIRDITEIKATAEQLQLATDFDYLTGLPNRALFLRKLRELARDPEQSIALIVLDLRDFRQLNDSYGQNIGDQLLIGTSLCLISQMPEDAFIARIAGDEFAVIVQPIGDRKLIENSTQSLLEMLKQGVSAGERNIPVRASVGITYGPEHALSPVELKNTADSACSQAKKQGNYTFAIFNRKLQEDADRARLIEVGLINAITQDELQIEYQPQVDTRTHRTAGMEALIRWENSEFGKVSPAEFIPTAEKSGLIAELGAWVLNKAIADYQQLAAFGLSPGVLSVNLSRKQFDSSELISSVRKILADTGMLPELLTLEITETAILDDRERAADVVNELHDIGVNLSIDDFGVGYSSFLELRDFPVNEVKIDRMFIKDITSCDNSRKIIQAIITVADAIGAEVVAEGIESQEQFECIKSLGCHRAQGYFLCEPMSISAFPDLVLNGADTVA